MHHSLTPLDQPQNESFNVTSIYVHNLGLNPLFAYDLATGRTIINVSSEFDTKELADDQKTTSEYAFWQACGCSAGR